MCIQYGPREQVIRGFRWTDHDREPFSITLGITKKPLRGDPVPVLVELSFVVLILNDSGFALSGTQIF
jgi:hypothetical protein